MHALNTVYLHITKACNLQCSYCYFQAGKPFVDELSKQELLLILEDLCKLKPKRIVFTGGEPLLRKEIFEIVRDVRNQFCIRLCISTNGTLINENNSVHLVECFDEIRISIDGTQAVNDAIRGTGTFEKIINGFDCVQKAGGNPVAFITITSLNLPNIENLMNFMFRRGIVNFHFSPLRLVGRAVNEKLMCNYNDAIEMVGAFWTKKFGLQLSTTLKESFNCGVGKYISVHPDGSVYPCHLLAYPEFQIGNVKKQGIINIYLQSKLMRQLRSLSTDKILRCSECFSEILQKERCLGLPSREEKFRKQLLYLLANEAE